MLYVRIELKLKIMKINPEETIKLKLPAHLFITFWHLLNVPAGNARKIDEFCHSKNTPIRYCPDNNYRDWNILNKELKEYYQLNNNTSIHSIHYDDPVKLQLNDEYEAEVVGDNIKVGCAEFPIEKIRELIEKIDENK